MAEIEYGGIKIGGSKLLLIVPLVGTIIASLYAGFELYSRYLSMEKKKKAMSLQICQVSRRQLSYSSRITSYKRASGRYAQSNS